MYTGSANAFYHLGQYEPLNITCLSVSCGIAEKASKNKRGPKIYNPFEITEDLGPHETEGAEKIPTNNPSQKSIAARSGKCKHSY